MKNNDFRELVDREFSALEWTDAQRLCALRQMNKEEHPVMKRKAITALVLILSIVVMSATALAVTVGLPTIQQLINQSDRRTSEYDYEPFTIVTEAVVTPGNQRHTSQLMDVSLTQAYMTTEALYLTLHVKPAAVDAILWHDSVPLVMNGQEQRYFDLYRQEELTLLGCSGFTLHSPYTDASGYCLQTDYAEARREPEDMGITYLLAYPLPEDELLPLNGNTVMCKFIVTDQRSHEWEFNALFFDLPKMNIVEAHDSYLIN